jgi:hypothetical protein
MSCAKRLDGRAAAARIEAWAARRIDESDRTAFRDVAETEPLALREGNFAPYAIRPAEFAAWQQVWTPCRLLTDRCGAMEGRTARETRARLRRRRAGAARG